MSRCAGTSETFEFGFQFATSEIKPANPSPLEVITLEAHVSALPAASCDKSEAHGLHSMLPNMVSVTEDSMRSSVHVAPLQIQKGASRSVEDGFQDEAENSSYAVVHPNPSSYMQMTPPATPNGSYEVSVEEQMDLTPPTPPIFHAFLRAFYPFHPPYTVSESTVTLPLNEGDVVLVHSIHTNGWADGTLLLSGARGWLPTNYCEAYEPESMRSLLKGLLNFWDLLKSGLTTDSELFVNQEFIRGIIAGVRYLLERSNCLTRESPMIKSSDLLRRNRKALLSDLSSLVKTAKTLKDFSGSASSSDSGDINDDIDGMILKAFRIVTRGVKFLDVLDDHVRSQEDTYQVEPLIAEDVYVPPTPPADSTSFQRDVPASDAGSRRTSRQSSATDFSSTQGLSEEQSRPWSYKRASTVHPASPINSSRPHSVHVNRLSVSHRVSSSSPFLLGQRSDLVSERLSAGHDTLLTYLASFMGRLHLQSQSSTDLLLTIRQSISAGRSLLTLVEAVYSHDVQSQQSLQRVRDSMYDCINQLILAARECVRSSASDEEDVMLPPESARLKDAATDCVIAAGKCVAITKFVIERIGDFELEPQSQGLGIDVSAFGASSSTEITSMGQDAGVTSKRSSELPVALSQDKPLPSIPSNRNSTTPTSVLPQPVLQNLGGQSSTVEDSPISTLNLLPPLTNISTPFMSEHEYSSSDGSSGADGEFQHSIRSDSMAISTSASSSTYLSSMRDSESSIISRTSTRATTPDISPYGPSHQSSFSSLIPSESHTTLVEDDYAESKMLEKTFAHELLHNKEGQITGGTLPALVERLTTHDSTPDAMFVSTFYLTFRLFVTPVHLAEALVERFDYVGESPHIAGPVRLRVYNVFKGWMESHWRDLSDHDAIEVIEPFAREKLCIVVPAAGKRLLELAHKVSSTDGPLVPRLVSSMGKTSTSIAQYIPPDTPLPAPVMSKGQLSTLKNWKMGGTSPTILDFDPLEFARQLTIKEMNIFCSIMPEELLASEWTKKTGSNAINVRAMSTLSTDLSNLVADTILFYEDAKKRAIMVKQWIKIADKCLELNNYDSLMAIICSLNSSTIMRLKKTWDIVSQKRKDMLKALQDIVEPTKNHAVLRQRLNDHVPPCLPFVGTYLTDLTFVDIGNPATKQLPGCEGQSSMTVINFDKHTRTAKIIGELQRFQIPYRLTEVPELQEWLQAQIVRVRCSNDQNNIQQYYRKSLLLEPRAHPQKASPVETQTVFAPQSFSKEKFDLFSWTYSKERSGPSQPTAVAA